MNRDQIITLAKDCGLTTGQHWDRSNMTTAFMVDFANAAIQHYKDSVLKEVGEPFGWWHQGETDDESDFYLAESRAGEDCSACTQLFTSDQLIAARKGLEEEIERLKDQLEAAQEELSQADCLNGKIIAENGTLKEQLATAEQRVAEACADLASRWGESHGCGVTVNASNASRKMAKAIRNGEWRKLLKEGE